ncbi:hypothetical protein [Bacillus haynesii]|uniref:hypothetical protein n=1 Tax=Bacillus haynesii TaxID=1925021 RepID=UPI00227F597D|nr:hypothetical protein [Bacillus haynesii]MCY7850099.1 hypothetical protein [Bacillus haynesii]MCY7914936.1 hypothetical protein [Bacillus haynesii]MCY7925529.1 hypothetical protein [Bacillus haynesii]MCY8000891.1 hypothetical protein [Bacillus haynesii]MCY8002673.1 hypothetical protein [Bacillus haynesii]
MISHHPYEYEMYSSRQQPPAMLWTPAEATEYLAQYRGQYIRTSITGFGVVIAQLTDYNPTTGTVDLNVYFTPGRPPSFMRVNRQDLTAIVPLGFQPPPEILAPPAPMPTTPTTPAKPAFCSWMPWHPMCQ